MPEELDEQQPEDFTFEEAMESLESIVSSLEEERLPLEEMVQGYERGVKLLRVCRSRIETARQRVELITADLEGRGKATLTDFASLDTTEPPSAAVGQEDVSKRPTRRKSAPSEPPTSTPPSSGEDIRLF